MFSMPLAAGVGGAGGSPCMAVPYVISVFSEEETISGERGGEEELEV